MSYLSISIKEAVLQINKPIGGWFLPAVQRPYVWGSRYESEAYICKLFDSILKKYPIGGLILWDTQMEIPYREFMQNYKEGDNAPLKERGTFCAQKCLVYDGQQRLQTLYSCLLYSFNNKILVFDLLNNQSSQESEIGFSFQEQNVELAWHFLRMNELFLTENDSTKKIALKNKILKKNPNNISEEELLIFESNFDNLWNIFVSTDVKSLSYFPVQSNNDLMVNEVFERLNTGGIPLSNADLLFSKIKSESYDFEEKLQLCSKKIYNATSKGFLFNAYSILQILHLIIRKRVRIEANISGRDEIKGFVSAWERLEEPLITFFADYIWGHLKINNNAIIPRPQAILPIILYFYKTEQRFKDISAQDIKNIDKFLITSQSNDWGLQSYADNFARIILENERNGFPKDEIFDFVKKSDKRPTEITEQRFTNNTWFALKMCIPNRNFIFDPDIQNRFNPEIDHIFPLRLKNQTQEYFDSVNVLWNLQPVKGEINLLKSNRHPKKFFNNEEVDSNGNIINGSEYLTEYDFIPKISSPLWESYQQFIANRKELMIEKLKSSYDIELIQ